jgi:hypothetical protein
MILIFGGGFLWYKYKVDSEQLSTSNQPKVVSISQDKGNDGQDQGSKNKGNDKLGQISKSNYPAILTIHKSNPKIGFNLALNLNESGAIYGYDRESGLIKKLYNYLQLPYRASNTSTRVSNNFILQTFQLDPESDQSFTQISWTYFDTQKNSNQKGYLGEIPLAYTTSSKSYGGNQSNAIPENVIWYGFSDSNPEILPTKDSEYGKNEFLGQGVYIYTKSLKDDVGTYLKDLRNNIEFKISDQYCSNIFASKTDFWCLNSQRKLVNLTTNVDIGEYSKIVTTGDGIVFATRNIDDLYSVVDQITFDDAGKPDNDVLLAAELRGI